MAVSATVTAGKIFSSDEVVTISELNKLGTPTVDISGAVGSLSLADGSVTNAKIAAATGIQYDKLEALATGELVVGNAGTATATTLSGDATIAADGAITIANNAVTTAKVLDANITTAKIADSTGASDGVTTAKLATGAVTGPKIAMTSDAQGDVLFRGASNYERLVAGVSGQVLTSSGAGADPSWVNNPVFVSQTFSTAGTDTWFKPTGVTWVVVQVVGGGGGGGQASSSPPGGNGGAGGKGMDWIDVSGDDTVDISVGAKGVGGVGVNESGTAGTESKFGDYVVSAGGGGGVGGASGGASGAAGAVTFDARLSGLLVVPGLFRGAGGSGGQSSYAVGLYGEDGFVIVRVAG